jgi:hypothetical protein
MNTLPKMLYRSDDEVYLRKFLEQGEVLAVKHRFKNKRI